MLCGFNLSLICKAINIYGAILEPRKKAKLHSSVLKVNRFHQIKTARRGSPGVLPVPSPLSFLSGLVFSLTQKSLEAGEPSLRHTGAHRAQKEAYIKRREEKNILGKYQTTYFMIFKCHFSSNIDFFMEDEL